MHGAKRQVSISHKAQGLSSSHVRTYASGPPSKNIVVRKRKEPEVPPGYPTWRGKYLNFRFAPLPRTNLPQLQAMDVDLNPPKPLRKKGKDKKDVGEEGAEGQQAAAGQKDPNAGVDEWSVRVYGNSVPILLAEPEERVKRSEWAREERERLLAEPVPPEPAALARLQDLILSPSEHIELTDIIHARHLISESSAELSPESFAAQEEDFVQVAWFGGASAVGAKGTSKASSSRKSAKAESSEKEEKGMLRTFGIPRKLIVEFRILPKPYTLLRQSSVDIVKWLSSPESSNQALLAPLSRENRVLELLPPSQRKARQARKDFVRRRIAELKGEALPIAEPVVAEEPTTTTDASNVTLTTIEEAEAAKPASNKDAKGGWSAETSGLASLLKSAANASTTTSTTTAANAAAPAAKLDETDVESLKEAYVKARKEADGRQKGWDEFYADSVKDIKIAEQNQSIEEVREIKQAVKFEKESFESLRKAHLTLARALRRVGYTEQNLTDLAYPPSSETTDSFEKANLPPIPSSQSQVVPDVGNMSPAERSLAQHNAQIAYLTQISMREGDLSFPPESGEKWDSVLRGYSQQYVEVQKEEGKEDVEGENPLLSRYAKLAEEGEKEKAIAAPVKEGEEKLSEDERVELRELEEEREAWSGEEEDLGALLASLEGEGRRGVITGKPGTGKSHMLLQVVEWATKVSKESAPAIPPPSETKKGGKKGKAEAPADQRWAVLYVPRTQNLLDSSTPYAYDLRTRTYWQGKASASLLKKFFEANKEVLSELKATKEHSLWGGAGTGAGIRTEQGPVSLNSGHIIGIEQGLISESSAAAANANAPTQTFPRGTPLTTLISLGTSNASLSSTASSSAIELAPLMLEWVLEEVAQNEQGVGLLVAVDSFQSLFSEGGKTRYRDPKFRRIKSWELSLPRLLLKYASGVQPIKRGAFLGAISSEDPEWPLGPEVRDAFLLGSSYGPLISGQGSVVLGDGQVSVGANDGEERTGGGLYEKRSQVLGEYLKGMTHIPLPDKLTLKEAQRLYEVWLSTGAITGSHNDEKFHTAYSQSAGNARDFIWKGFLSSLDI